MKNRLLVQRIFALLFLAPVLFLGSCKKNVEPATDPTTETTGTTKADPLVTARVPASETLQTLDNGTFLIVNRKSGMVLDVASAATANGSNVLQWGGTGGTNQRWTLTQLPGGYYSIIGVQSGRALEVYQSGTADGDNVSILDYSGADNQQWQFIATSDGYYRIVNRNSGRDLDVAAQSESPGANVAQWTYWGGENQQWGLLKVTHSGQLTWTLTSTGVPPDVQTRITNAMNDACARYNALADWPARTLTVEYNTGVATADGSTTGNIRFGPTASYQAVRTAMHEIGHTYGVGLSSGWTANISGGLFVGTTAVDAIHSFDGPSAVINTGGGHFWPYGLNYDNEWSEANAFRHVKMIWAMRADGM
ncbi:hypothetical protein A3860_08150 [Niastella vici]|uniref:Ricin B lectin domain-containing protein n=1 Tax=Niastella vici TaxID=1703345 RepID=A0A1V9FIW6_9BACT|nr:RICIN domain-containing protein [Niastella vici]OQP58280.1 hypothetical protein A3860_08150 [Niastella vici]